MPVAGHHLSQGKTHGNHVNERISHENQNQTRPRSAPGRHQGGGVRNETENGVRFNVTFSRLYKDGDQWQSTDSFGRDDLLQVAKVADQAHSWIFAQSQEKESESQPAAAPAG